MKRIALTAILAIALGLTVGACKRGGGDTTEKKTTTTPATKAGGVSEDIKKGRTLYVNNTCATCHGVDGKGDGPAGMALKPRPRNFRELASYKQGSKMEDIAETLKTGVPGTNMTSFKHIPEADRLLIAKYVIHLQKN